jgi:putative DNA base modification enzyme with NMAD domain
LDLWVDETIRRNSDMAKDIYVYKMTQDNGGAPCVSHGLLSLAICKPIIRRSAKVGDFVLGFGGKNLPPDGRLIYAMRVTDRKCWCDYAINYWFRRDCIYRCVNSVFSNRSNAGFSWDMDHDLGGAPRRVNAFVLLSTDFRYFGRCNKVAFATNYPILHQRVTRLGVGHIKKHVPPLRSELDKLIDDVWKTFPKMKICGPTNPRSKGCDRQPDEPED